MLEVWDGVSEEEVDCKYMMHNSSGWGMDGAMWIIPIVVILIVVLFLNSKRKR
ncbi:hypothetical protein BH09BAC3_BH09BAC3_06260 [soil metagenome]